MEKFKRKVKFEITSLFYSITTDEFFNTKIQP